MKKPPTTEDLKTRDLFERLWPRPPRRPGREPFAGDDHTGMPPADASVPANLAAIEHNALRRHSPTRNRWPEIVDFDLRVTELEQRRATVAAEIAAVQQRRQAAPVADAEALARWTLNGEQGPRPEPQRPKLDERSQDLQRESDALTLAAGEILAEKAAFVEKHRARLVQQADKETQAAQDRYLALIDQLADARSELAELRQAALWASTFPSEEATRNPATQAIAGGLKKPAEKAGLSQVVDASRILELLQDDARWLRDAATAQQRAAMLGRDPRKHAGGAVWAGTPEAIEQSRRDKEAEREQYKKVWGHEPAQWYGGDS
jgi:hypothetical protein